MFDVCDIVTHLDVSFFSVTRDVSKCLETFVCLFVFVTVMLLMIIMIDYKNGAVSILKKSHVCLFVCLLLKRKSRHPQIHIYSELGSSKDGQYVKIFFKILNANLPPGENTKVRYSL